jgi:hypothetical protein
MDIDACLAMYSKLGSRIFGNSRQAHICGNPFKGKRLWAREKYDSKAFEKLLQEMIGEIGTTKSSDGHYDYFPSDENQCKT